MTEINPVIDLSPTLEFTTVEMVNEYVEKNGVLSYAEMPAEIYHKTNAISHSSLRNMRSSPSKYLWETNHVFPSSPAQTLGTAIHLALLEPEKFDLTYRVTPKFDGRTKAGKEAKEKWEIENKDKLPISEGDMETVFKVVKRVEGDEFLRRLFKGGKNEKSFFCKDEETGLVQRCRPDCILLDPINVIIDLKTTDCAEEWVFKGDIDRYGYLTQAAYYMDIVEKCTSKRPEKFMIVAVEKNKDCDVNVFFFSNDALEKGRKMYRSWLNRLAECLRENKWPGYDRRFIQYDTPEWLAKKIEREF